MAAKKLSAEEWVEYRELYRQLAERLAAEPWFADGWETRYALMGGEKPSGVWFQLVRDTWFDGSIHLETWLKNSVLEQGAAPLVLHVETSKAKHGLSRNDFTRVFLERCGAEIASWPGYTVKPNYAMGPFSVQVPFTRETLVGALAAELERVRKLGPAIDETIAAVRD